MLRRLSTLVAGMVLLTLLPASAAENPFAPASRSASPSTGVVIFFREKKYMGGGVAYKVRENGVEVCKLKNGSYCILKIRTGKHQYEVHAEAKDVLTLEVESGENYFVSFNLGMGVVAGRPNLTPSDAATFYALRDKLTDNTGKDLKR